jgi:hypothetical protein
MTDITRKLATIVALDLCDLTIKRLPWHQTQT